MSDKAISSRRAFYSRDVSACGLVQRPLANPVFEWASEYSCREFAIVPIPYRTKNPARKGWQDLQVFDLQKDFGRAKQNIGVLLGERSGWLVDIDLDSSEAIKIADFFLPLTSMVFGRQSKPSSHRLYVCPDAKFGKFNDPVVVQSANPQERKNACIVEIRTGVEGKGIQTVFPPSTHEGGEPIEWIRYGEPANVAARDLEMAVKRLAAAALLAKHFQIGIRHDLSLAIAGTLLRNGFDAAETKHFIRAVCVAADDEEMLDRLGAVEDTVTRLREGGNAFGLPKFLELVDSKVGRALCDWLNIGRDRQRSTVPPEPTEPFNVICMQKVKAKKVEWLWKPFIPIGEFTIMEGIEGIGKSWLGFALAGAVASGNRLPFDDGAPMEPGNVLLLPAEDSLAHTIRPRLDSMEVDLSRIFAIDEVFSLKDVADLIHFEAELAKYRPKLVVIDPIFSYTAGNDLNAESASRPIARKLIALAQKYNCAIVGIRHVGKSKGLGDPRNAGLGSISWRASARSVLLVGQDADTGERAVCQTKNNLAEMSDLSVGFDIKAGQFLFNTRPSQLTKERMLAQAKDPDSKAEQAEAVEFLRETLRSGEKSSKEVERESKELAITGYALKKARAVLGVESFKKGGTFGGDKKWYLRLPGPAEIVYIQDTRHLQQNGSDKTIYDNGLTEDGEIAVSRPDQQSSPTSSAPSDAMQRQKVTCACGEPGYIGYGCRNCGEEVSSAENEKE
jgi:hypothetical protein